MSIFDEQGRWLWISTEPPEVRGKLIGKRVWDFTADERDARIVREAFARASFDREPSEYRIKAGGNRTYDVRLEPLPTGFVARWREVPKKQVNLTHREREVLLSLCADETTDATAHRLGIAKPTVETYRRRIREKTGTHGIVGMIRWAVANGICEI